MSALVQPLAMKAALDALIAGNDIKVVLLDSTYTYSAAHDFLNDIGGGSILGTSPALTSVTTTDGILSADNPDVSGVGVGDIVTQLWFYIDTGVSTTSQLFVYSDKNADTTPINYTGDGADITVVLPGGEVGRL